jgi:hypothetical protein
MLFNHAVFLGAALFWFGSRAGTWKLYYQDAVWD